MAKYLEKQQRLFGHPTGIYTLFFAEMWERFSYYGMRALLILYVIKGFLGYGDRDANAIYGAYTALVYMTPFFGGMIADRLLGARTTVVIGGVLMALGHLLMTIETELAFFTALGLLICGNGFFKPNISTIVGNLYPAGSPKRDGGFTIFYIGINLGAAMAPLLCGYVGETYGWHYGFGMATIGMIVGLAVFVAPTFLTQILILLTAVASAIGLVVFNAGDIYSIILNVFVAISLIVSGGVAVSALARGGLPTEAGMAPNPSKYFVRLAMVVVGTIVIIPVFVMLVSGFSVLPGIDSSVTLLGENVIKPLEESESPLIKGLATFVEEAGRPAGLVLILSGIGAFGFLLFEALRMDLVAKQRMFVVFILTFFSLLFWSFFEQSGSSLNNFTDRNVNRVMGGEPIESEFDVGDTIDLRIVVSSSDENLSQMIYLSQQFLGHENGDTSVNDLMAQAIRWTEEKKEASKQMSATDLEQQIAAVNEQELFTITALTYLREFAKREGADPSEQTMKWQVTEENIGKILINGNEIPASVFQSVNPIFIMIFGLVFTGLWGFMGSRGREPSTPVKFAMGLMQLGLGFLCLYFGAMNADGNGMVFFLWLILMYLLLTTGELCLSPVGLSMVTKLSPARLVSTVMGSWFLATAFSQFMAAIIAQFAAVPDAAVIPAPTETVDLYGDLYGMIGSLAVGCGLVCLVLSPILKRWMHMDIKDESSELHEPTSQTIREPGLMESHDEAEHDR